MNERSGTSPKLLSLSQLAIAGAPAAGILLLTGVLVAQGTSAPSKSEKRILRKEITSELRLSVERGFNFLVREQRKRTALATHYPVAGNALAGLAFLAGGYTNKEGPYARTVQKIIDVLLKYQKNGYFDDRESRMYGHGFATLFLAELYGMTGQQDTAIREALKKAVRLIERAQCKDGGWDYNPSTKPSFLGYSGASDTSITVCQTMALRAARNLGIAVNSQVVKRAKRFIEEAQNRDGGFAYRIKGRRRFARKSEFPRSAAGVCILLSLGEYDSERILKGFEYLMRNYRDYNHFPYYADYYCTQAMFQAGGRYWKEYFSYVREKLIRKQRPAGSWDGGYGGPVQSTAMALIVLQVPYRFLPISER